MSDAELLYDALAAHIDAVGEDLTPVFLAKVALALGHALGDTESALAILAECAEDLTRDP